MQMDLQTRVPQWYILPEHYSPLAHSVFRAAPIQYVKDEGMKPHTYFSANELVQDYNETLHVFNSAFKIKLAPTNGTSVFPTKKGISELKEAIQKNETVRWLLKRLIHPWRLKRFRASNTEDVMTGEIPKKPVHIYDWNTRSKYVFEAATLHKDICSRLCLAEEQFPTPKPPRNMFTNEPLTYGQLFGALRDLESYGVSSWVTKAFASENYSVESFERTYAIPLKKHALKILFSSHSNPDYIDTLLEFIQFEYEYHDREFIRPDVWVWMIEHDPTDERIQAWRNICYKYYTAVIHMGLRNDMSEIHALSEKLVFMSIHSMVVKSKIQQKKSGCERVWMDRWAPMPIYTLVFTVGAAVTLETDGDESH